MSDEQYRTEYRRLLSVFDEQFAIGDSPRENLLQAIRMIEHEMNENGGCNWLEADYAEYLETIRNALTAERRFSAEQHAKIRSSLAEIIACGRELENDGESSRPVTETVHYLVARVVDWCRMNPKSDNGGGGQ